MPARPGESKKGIFPFNLILIGSLAGCSAAFFPIHGHILCLPVHYFYKYALNLWIGLFDRPVQSSHG
jgi:hypothetical protein